MADKNVRFVKVALQATYDALVEKDIRALYWIEETQRLYCGSTLYGTGAEASDAAAGLLSARDYALLQELIEAGPASKAFTPVDGSIVIADGKIGVGISAVEGNLIKVVDDGIFAKVDKVEILQVDGLEDRLASIEKAAVGGVHYRGSVATKDDLPADAMQGDLYECIDTGVEYCWNGKEWFEYGSAHFVPVAGIGIDIDGNKISVKIADNSHGLVAVDGAMSINLATATSDGAMSKEDKAFIDAIPSVYASKKFVNEICEQVKYDITSTPNGTLVNYGENEIRIMCPANAEFVKQSVGAGGDANTYYMTLKTYAPSDDVVGYIEHLGGQVDSEILTDLKTDEHGRKYQPTWLGVAKYNETTGTWSYYGDKSTASKYVGWDYQIDWYDSNGVMIASDSVRINLSNEDCHNVTKPYYMNGYATIDQVEAMSEFFTWGEL